MTRERVCLQCLPQTTSHLKPYLCYKATFRCIFSVSSMDERAKVNHQRKSCHFDWKFFVFFVTSVQRKMRTRLLDCFSIKKMDCWIVFWVLSKYKQHMCKWGANTYWKTSLNAKRLQTNCIDIEWITDFQWLYRTWMNLNIRYMFLDNKRKLALFTSYYRISSYRKPPSWIATEF